MENNSMNDILEQYPNLIIEDLELQKTTRQPQEPYDALCSCIHIILDAININNKWDNTKLYTCSRPMLDTRQYKHVLNDTSTLYVFTRCFDIPNHTTIREVNSTVCYRHDNDIANAIPIKDCDDIRRATVIRPNILIINVMSIHNLYDVMEKAMRMLVMKEEEFNSYIYKNSPDTTNLAINRMIERRMDKLMKTVDASRVNFLNYKQKLIKAEQQLKTAEEALITYKHQMQNNVASLQKSVSWVKSHMANVKDAQLIMNDRLTLQVDTDKMYVNSMGYKFYMGEYRITVDLEDSTVRFENLTEENRRKSYWGAHCMHPHVSESGNPCLGNISSALITYIKDLKINAIVCLLISYLENVNPGDIAGQNLTNWDIVDDNGDVIDFPVELTSCADCGKRVTENNKDRFHVCADCGRNYCESHIEETSIYKDGKEDTVYLCTGCIHNYVTCSICSHTVHRSQIVHCDECGMDVCTDCAESVLMSDGSTKTLCSSCLDKYDTAECSICHNTVRISSNENPSDDFVCQHCQNNTCDFCGCISSDALQLGNETLCRDCFSSTNKCSFCGTRRKNEELIYDDRTGTYRCAHGCV